MNESFSSFLFPHPHMVIQIYLMNAYNINLSQKLNMYDNLKSENETLCHTKTIIKQPSETAFHTLQEKEKMLVA